MPQTILVTLLLALSLSLSGCARSLSGSTYPRSDARQVQQAQMGTVQHVRQVQIEGTDSKIGAVAGGIAGGIAGSSVGGGKGQDIATVAGVIVGGIAGSAAEELGTRQLGFEITVTLDNDRTIVVVQGADEVFQVGDRVRVVTGGSGTRITH